MPMPLLMLTLGVVQWLFLYFRTGELKTTQQHTI